MKRTLIILFFAALYAVNASANTLTVMNTSDGGTGSLRQAIIDAAVNDTIDCSVSSGSTITLTSGELLIDKNLTISGPGANALTVQRSAAGNTAQFSVFHIAANSYNVTISGLAISNGNTTGNGGGIFSEISEQALRRSPTAPFLAIPRPTAAAALATATV